MLAAWHDKIKSIKKKKKKKSTQEPILIHPALGPSKPSQNAAADILPHPAHTVESYGLGVTRRPPPPRDRRPLRPSAGCTKMGVAVYSL